MVTDLRIAYGFARIRFVWRNVWFVCMLLTMMLPFEVIIDSAIYHVQLVRLGQHVLAAYYADLFSVYRFSFF